MRSSNVAQSVICAKANGTGPAMGRQNIQEPGRMSAPSFDGALFVDMEGQRARYECLRPACPQPRVGPVTADRDGIDTLVGFIADAKSQHLAQHHHGETSQ